MGKIDFNYEHISSIIDQRREINMPDFNDINVYLGGELVEFTKEMRESAKFTGLLNIDLIKIFVEELNKKNKSKSEEP